MVKRMLDSPHAEELQLRRLNYGVVTLIPKTKDAATIKQYRPICLYYVCYKIVTKVLTNRLERVADKVVSKSQTAFMKNGNLCPSRSRYMFGLLWIVEERISGYFRWGGLHPFSVRTRWAPILG